MLDACEGERSTASQAALKELYDARVAQQRAAETRENLAKLQPAVSSLPGIFREAELNNVAAIDAMIKGYPLPQYDEKSGTYVPNPDRRAEPMPKTKLREARQVSHSRSSIPHSDPHCRPAGDPLDDLRSAAPHLFDAEGALLRRCPAPGPTRENAPHAPPAPRADAPRRAQRQRPRELQPAG